MLQCPKSLLHFQSAILKEFWGFRGSLFSAMIGIRSEFTTTTLLELLFEPNGLNLAKCYQPYENLF